MLITYLISHIMLSLYIVKREVAEFHIACRGLFVKPVQIACILISQHSARICTILNML